MKKGLLIMLFVLTLTAWADNYYLISCDSDLSLFRQEKASVYYLHEETAMIRVAETELSVIQKRFSNANVLEKWIDSESYYIVSHPNQKVRYRSDFGTKVYEDEKILIVRNQEIPAKCLFEFSFTKLQEIKLPDYDKRFIQNGSNTTREEVQNLVNQVNQDSVEAIIQGLQDFETRFCYADNRDLVAAWIDDKFQSYGISETVVDSFYYNNVWHKNVIGILPGSVYPEKYIVLGGHHDSVNNSGNPYISAPGADDNASACAATLEVARVMVEQNYQPYHTILFMTFAAEEVGLVGSSVIASAMAQEGMDVRLMINNDMIAYNPYPSGNWPVRIIQYAGYEYLADFAWNLMEEYTTLQQGTLQTNSSSSDSWSFYSNGYAPVYFFEEVFNPYYHSSNDVIDNCDIPYATEVVKLNAATLSTFDKMPAEIDELYAYDTGDGTSIYLNWETIIPPNFSHFIVGYGTESGNYSDYEMTTDNSLEITGLEEGVLYYFGVSVVNEEDFSSFFVEITATPNEIPNTPQLLTANPHPEDIQLQWEENSELDLNEYRLYRSDEIDGTMDLLWNGIQASYSDSEVDAGEFYYYMVKAVDDSGNESEPSEIVRGRLVSLDQGILVVDDTRDGTGNFMSPTQEESDAFNEMLLTGFAYNSIDTDNLETVRLDEICAYSTVLWLVYDTSNLAKLKDSAFMLSEYLSFGGNVLISAVKPSMLLGANSYPYTFPVESFANEYLGIAEGFQTNTARFRYAISEQPELTGLEVDPDKALAALDYHIMNVESITPTANATAVYHYGSDYDETSPFGAMNGMPIGVLQDSELYKSALFSFPFYNMLEEDAQDLVEYLLLHYFGENTFTDFTEIPSPNRITLRNYPNPFNPETTIQFSLPKSGNVKLEIFNIKGQNIKTLIDKKLQGGEHAIVWDGKATSGESVGSGMYFYKIMVDKKTATKKMILLK